MFGRRNKFRGYHRGESYFGLIFVVLGTLLVGASCGASCLAHGDREEVTAVVTGKERIHGSGNGKDAGYYLIYTEDEVFQNADSILEGKFNSSDFQARIHEHKCYRFEVYGWRIPFLSAYRNIASYEEVECPQGTHGPRPD